MVVPGQRLDRLCAKFKFLKIKVLLQFKVKVSELNRKTSRDSVAAFHKIAFLTKYGLKRGTIVLLLLLKLYAVQGLFVK